MRRNSIHKQGLYLGSVPERAAAAGNGSTPLTLDHDLDVLPEAGRRLTVADLAEHVEDLAGRISAAGVKAGQHVVVHKAANFDVWLLATAVARTGAVPVMLSHTLDAPTMAALMERLDRPHLLTDGPKLEALAGLPLAELTRGVISVGAAAPGWPRSPSSPAPRRYGPCSRAWTSRR